MSTFLQLGVRLPAAHQLSCLLANEYVRRLQAVGLPPMRQFDRSDRKQQQMSA
jgi:hypothetical protein